MRGRVLAGVVITGLIFGAGCGLEEEHKSKRGRGDAPRPEDSDIDGRPADTITLTVEISQHLLLFIKYQHIGGLPREFTHNGPKTLPGRNRQHHDSVLWDLPDVVETVALYLGAQKLTKRRRAQWVAYRACDQMKPCGFGLA